MYCSSMTLYRCEPAQYNDVCNLIRPATKYQMAISNESELLVRFVSESASNYNTSSKCSQFFAFTLCFYLFRNCELSNVSDPTSSVQLTICSEKCTGVGELYRECIIQEELQSFRNNVEIESLRSLLSFAVTFECTHMHTHA